MKKNLLLLIIAVLSMAVSAHAVQNIKLPKPDQGKARHSMTVPRADFSPSLLPILVNVLHPCGTG